VRRRLTGALAACALLLAFPAAALSQTCPRTTLGEIEDEVMCPVCGTPLGLATESPQAQRERAFIEDLIADCRSEEEVKRALVAEFGEGVLALPGDDAAGDDDLGDVLVYAIPALAIVLAAGGIVLATLRWKRRGPGSATPAVPGEPAGTGRLEEDMERYEL
jgi:cytochrome c-type biogenesis protein CcmH